MPRCQTNVMSSHPQAGARARARASRHRSGTRGIYEPLERRVMLCAELHDQPLPPASFVAEPPSVPAQISRLAAGNQAEGGGMPDGGGGQSNIVWVNRGQASDNFAATFGANAALARGVVDAVIAQYQSVITSFNWIGSATQHSLTISMRNQAAPDFGGQCPPNQVGLDASGAPVSATIFLGRGNDTDGDGLGDGAGWFLDPTPNDFAEFTNVVNGFVGTAAAGSPAQGLRDFYSLVAHEMGHAMGMTSASGSDWRTDLGAFASDTGVADANGAGNLWAYQSPSVGRAVLTDSDLAGQGVIGVHSAVGGQVFNFNAQTYTSAMDVMNNTFQGINGRRLLVSNLLIGMLDDVYGYDTIWPEQFGSMYTSLDTATGQLTLRGGAGASSDVFRVTAMNGGYQISVDIGTDVPGTGPTDAFESFWTDAQVSSIVIDAGGGNDTIQIRTISADTPVTVNAGAGDDLIQIGIGDFDTNVQSNITVNGGTGSDRIWVNDLVDGPGGDSYTLSNTTFSKPTRSVAHSSIERIQILGSDNNNTWNIESFNGEVIAEGGDGNDTFNIAQPGGDLDAITGRMTLLGGTGNDSLNLYDHSDTVADNYLFDAPGADNLNFTKPANPGNFTGILFSSIENMLLEANNSTNTITVEQLFAANVTLNGNGGNDTLNLGAGNIDFNVVVTNLTFNGGSGNDTMILDDTADTGNDTHVFDRTLFTNTYTKTNDPLVVRYVAVEDITLDTSSATNRIEVNGLPLNTHLLIEGNLGQDTAVIGGGNIDANILGTVHFDAFINGRVIFNDTGAGPSSTYNLSGGTFTKGGLNYTFANVNRAELNTSDFGDNITISSTFGYDLILRANDGNDLIRFGGGSLAFMGDATILGGAGGDELFFDDTTTFAPTTYTINQTGGLPFVELFNGNQKVVYDGLNLLDIDAGPFNDTIRSIAVPSLTTLRINGNGGDDFIDVQGHPTLNSALFPRVIVDGGTGLDTVEVNTDGQGGARAEFRQSQTLHRLALGASGRLRLAEGGHLIDVANSVSMPASGFELDLADGFFVRRGNASLPFYRDRIAVGYNGGAWNGLGINSSTAASSAIGDALGIARASELFNGGGGTIAGINLAANDILIRHTLYGDANLDGTVNLADFNRLVANFGASPTSWSQGDFNYDEVTNLADFNLLASNFGASASPQGAGAAAGGSTPTRDDLMKLLQDQTGGGIVDLLGSSQTTERRIISGIEDDALMPADAG